MSRHRRQNPKYCFPKGYRPLGNRREFSPFPRRGNCCGREGRPGVRRPDSFTKSSWRLARLPRAAPPRRGTEFVRNGGWGQAAGAINGALQRLNADSVVAPVNGQVAWRWVGKSSGVSSLVGRIVRSVVELLTSGNIQSGKQYAAENCGWLSIDHSRNRNRRWCEMRTCGSQHKARAYYRRKTTGFQRRKLRRSSASTVAF